MTTDTASYEVGQRCYMYVTEYPKWWQFWKKPVRVEREFVVTKVGGPNT